MFQSKNELENLSTNLTHNTLVIIHLLGKLVRQDALPVVLSSLAYSARCQWCSDDILQLYHSLLLQLGTKGESTTYAHTS